MDIRAVIKSQYHAALAMFRQTVQKCPHELWDDSAYKNQFWNIAAHALFYTHFYLHPCEEDYQPWPEIDLSTRLFEQDEQNVTPPSQGKLLRYADFIGQQIDPMVDAVELTRASGFDWLPFNKLELQFYNLRHLMLHTGELSERLWQSSGQEVDWVGKSG